MAKVPARMKQPTVLDLPEREARDPIPDFASEREEADDWASHGIRQSILGQESEDDSGLPRLPRQQRPTSVRFDASTIARLKALAALRDKGYQTLLKEFVVERLHEEEKREGLVPRSSG